MKRRILGALAASGTSLAAVPMIVLFIFAQKRFVAGLASFGVKG